MRGRYAVGVIAAALVVLGACSSGGSSDRVAQHAETAASVMTRDRGWASSRDAAWQVVGRTGDASIEALQADGTTYDGTIVLRISVAGSGSIDDASDATRCYRYTFTSGHESGPTGIDCPDVAPLRLSAPVTGSALFDTVAVRLRASLQALPLRSRHDVAAVRAAAAAPAPHYPVRASATGSRVHVTVLARDQCVGARIRPDDSVWVASSPSGTDC